MTVTGKQTALILKPPLNAFVKMDFKVMVIIVLISMSV